MEIKVTDEPDQSKIDRCKHCGYVKAVTMTNCIINYSCSLCGLPCEWIATCERDTSLHDKPEVHQLFIRFGEIPEDEQSSIHYRSYYCGKEPGVSVYDCLIWGDGIPQIVLPTPYLEGALNTLTGLLIYNKDRPVYLVSGDVVGRGHDNEPLIKNIKIVKDITKEFRAQLGNEDKLHDELMRLAEENEPMLKGRNNNE